MANSILLKLFSSLLLFTAPSNATKCSPTSPEIQPPFRLRATHPPQLSCNPQNQTTIHFPNDILLHVTAISYATRRLSLRDPQNCVPRVFLNLNLSQTPFRYYHDVRRYKYVNCSERLAGIEAVPCLSGAAHHVYVVEPSFLQPLYCSAVKTVAIPFSYSPYLSDSSFGLGLTWPAPLGEAEYDRRALYAAVLGIIAVVFIVGKLLYAKHGGEFNEEKFMGEYEALRL